MTMKDIPTPAAGALLQSLASNWWLLLLRGLAAVGFGLLALFWPGLTLVSLTFLWGAYALADGILAIWAAISGQSAGTGPRWWLAAVGVLGILAAGIAFLQPSAVAGALLLLIAAWSFIVGIMTIWGAIELRKEIDGEWLLIFSGIIAIAFAALLVSQPAASALALIWVIGLFTIVLGLNHIALAFKVKRLAAA